MLHNLEGKGKRVLKLINIHLFVLYNIHISRSCSRKFTKSEADRFNFWKMYRKIRENSAEDQSQNFIVVLFPTDATWPRQLAPSGRISLRRHPKRHESVRAELNEGRATFTRRPINFSPVGMNLSVRGRSVRAGFAGLSRPRGRREGIARHRGHRL